MPFNYAIYVDLGDHPDVGEIVVVKKKKSRAAPEIILALLADPKPTSPI